MLSSPRTRSTRQRAPAEQECPRCLGYGFTRATKVTVAMANDRKATRCAECQGTGVVES